MRNTGKLLALLAVLAVGGYTWLASESVPQSQRTAPVAPPTHSVNAAFDNRLSDVQVEGQGTVSRILPDDREGSRHQRFVLRLPGNRTVLVVHNIDLAPRINALREGDIVNFYGEYEWNAKGGVIHWTHHDPEKRHVDGWLRHQGRTYQ